MLRGQPRSAVLGGEVHLDVLLGLVPPVAADVHRHLEGRGGGGGQQRGGLGPGGPARTIPALGRVWGEEMCRGAVGPRTQPAAQPSDPQMVAARAGERVGPTSETLRLSHSVGK